MKPHKILSMRDLKIIAYVTMLIDHIGAVILINLMANYGSYSFPIDQNSLYELYNILRTIGRISFPLFSFSIVEGFIHTKDIKKYIIRLFIFALVSEIPFNLAISNSLTFPAAQNVIFTFLLGIIPLYIGKRVNNDYIGLGLIILGAFLGEYFHTDYGAYGVVLLGVFYYLRNFEYIKYLVWGGLIYSNTPYGLISLIFVALYNGKKGMGAGRWLYLFYPVHLLILYLIVVLINNIYIV